MSKEALADLVTYSSIVQGFGIIFAIFLSWWQMRRTNAVTQTAQYQGALQLMLDWRSDIIADPSLVGQYHTEEFFDKAFEILPAREYFHTMKLLHIFEHCWLLNSRGVIPRDMWDPWSYNLILLMRQDKKRTLWNYVKTVNVFNRKFVTFVDKIVSEEDQKSKKHVPGIESAEKAMQAPT
jgi:hypothetical protein